MQNAWNPADISLKREEKEIFNLSRIIIFFICFINHSSIP